MLSMKNIRKIYRTDLIETHALDGVSVDVAAGEFVAVMGRSGSGKTTFLNVAGLLDTFDEGTYHLDGQDVSRLSDAEPAQTPPDELVVIRCQCLEATGTRARQVLSRACNREHSGIRRLHRRSIPGDGRTDHQNASPASSSTKPDTAASR